MSKKNESIHPDIGTGRVGLAVADMQTLHRGHVALLNEMRFTCDVCIVALGSTERYGIEGHPFTFQQRAEMIRGLFGADVFRFVPLNDIDARDDLTDWYAYVLKKISGMGLPEPTDYFGGSEIDARWYFHAFASTDDERSVRPGVVTYTRGPRRLHIVDRSMTDIPSGREVRLLIEMRDPQWKKFVAERLHRYVELNYPPALRQPLGFDDVRRAFIPLGDAVPTTWLFANDRWPAGEGIPPQVDADLRRFVGPEVADTIRTNTWASRHSAVDLVMAAAAKAGMPLPVGTRVSFDQGEVLELKDDGRWRPLQKETDKQRWAKEARNGMRGTA